jgi:hypothetical protein
VPALAGAAPPAPPLPPRDPRTIPPLFGVPDAGDEDDAANEPLGTPEPPEDDGESGEAEPGGASGAAKRRDVPF